MANPPANTAKTPTKEGGLGWDTLWSKDGSQGTGEGWNGIVPSIPLSPAGRLARPVTVGRTSHGLRSMAQKPFQPSPAPWLPLPGTMTHATLGKWSLHFHPLPAERAGMREGRGCLGEPSGGRLFILRGGARKQGPTARMPWEVERAHGCALSAVPGDSYKRIRPVR